MGEPRECSGGWYLAWAYNSKGPALALIEVHRPRLDPLWATVGCKRSQFHSRRPLRSLNVGPQRSAIGFLVDFLKKCVLFMHFYN
jgi:hypothetical protein